MNTLSVHRISSWVNFGRLAHPHRNHRPIFTTQVRIFPIPGKGATSLIGKSANKAIQDASQPDHNGWLTIDLNFDTLETARSRLLAFGGAVEVLKPEVLRLSIADYAQQISAV